MINSIDAAIDNDMGSTQHLETQEESATEESNVEEVEMGSEPQEEATTEEGEEVVEDETTPEGITVVSDGQEITLNSLEEAQKYIENQTALGGREDTLALAQEELGIESSDLALIAAAKKGDLSAISKIVKDSGMELSELFEKIEEGTEEFNEDFVLPETSPEEKYLKTSFSEEEGETFANAAMSGGKEFANEIIGSIENMKAFRRQVQSGLAAELLPQAIRESKINGTSVFDEYARLGHEKASSKSNESTEEKNKPASKANGVSVHEKPLEEMTEDDIWNMSPEDFKKYVDYQPQI